MFWVIKVDIAVPYTDFPAVTLCTSVDKCHFKILFKFNILFLIVFKYNPRLASGQFFDNSNALKSSLRSHLIILQN